MLSWSRIRHSAGHPLRHAVRNRIAFLSGFGLTVLVLTVLVGLIYLILQTVPQPGFSIGGRGGMTIRLLGGSYLVPTILAWAILVSLSVVLVTLLAGWVRWFRADRPALKLFRPNSGVVWAIAYTVVVLLFVGFFAMVFGALFIGAMAHVMRDGGDLLQALVTVPVSIWFAFMGMRLTMAVATQGAASQRDFRAAWNSGRGHAFQAIAGQILLATPFAVIVVFIAPPAHWLSNALDLVTTLVSSWQGVGLPLLAMSLSKLAGLVPPLLMGVIGLLAGILWSVLCIGVMAHALDDDANLPSEL